MVQCEKNIVQSDLRWIFHRI